MNPHFRIVSSILMIQNQSIAKFDQSRAKIVIVVLLCCGICIRHQMNDGDLPRLTATTFGQHPDQPPHELRKQRLCPTILHQSTHPELLSNTMFFMINRDTRRS